MRFKYYSEVKDTYFEYNDAILIADIRSTHVSFFSRNRVKVLFTTRNH